MVKKFVIVITLFACLFNLVLITLYFINGFDAPVLSCFLGIIMMLGLIYFNKKQYEEGKIKRDMWITILVVGLLAVIFGINDAIIHMIPRR